MTYRSGADLAGTLIATARTLTRRQQAVWQDLQREMQRSRVLIEQSRTLMAQLSAAAEPGPAALRRGPKVRKRNKLFYKHRWLVSASVVAALRRAGVDCNIVVPAGANASSDRLSPDWERASLGLVDEGTLGPDMPSGGTLH
jgi:hypothetical protein